MKLRSPFKESTITGELTSLVDIIFLLIIFFMLTTSFKKHKQHIPMEMPMSKSPKYVLTDNQVVIEVNRAGQYFVEGAEKTMEQLYTHFRTHKPGEKQVVVIRGDQEAPFQSIVHIYDILQELGVSRMAHEVKKK